MEFPHIAAVLPEIKEADEKFEEAMRNIKGNRDIEAFAAEYNAVLLKAVEALYQDTKHVNSRDKIFSVYARVHEGGLTFFGNAPYVRLKKAVETGSIRYL